MLTDWKKLKIIRSNARNTELRMGWKVGYSALFDLHEMN